MTADEALKYGLVHSIEEFALPAGNKMFHAYDDLAKYGYTHGTVDHSAKQYVVGAIHTNTIEGFWSIFKRGIVGSFHKISRKYMPLYVAEFQFRYNNRMNADIFGEAISAC